MISHVPLVGIQVADITFITNSRQTAEFERQSEKWAEVKRNLEEQFHAVQNELRNQEMAVSAKQKGTKLKNHSESTFLL